MAEPANDLVLRLLWDDIAVVADTLPQLREDSDELVAIAGYSSLGIPRPLRADESYLDKMKTG